MEAICEEQMNQNELIRNSKLKIANGNHSTFLLWQAAKPITKLKIPNWHCRAKNFRANESRAKLVKAMPSAAENHLRVKCMK